MTVTLQVDANDLRYWDVDKHAFVLEKGRIDFFVGPLSADERLKGEFMVE
ncbi:MAG: fibronectin type III-like domain-contianing protein [Ginsengibacter sp.]